MKKYLLSIIVLSISITNLTAQNSLSVLYSSTGMEYGKASAIDADTNYISGSLFQNTIYVNPNGTTNLTAPGATTQIALTKFDKHGNLLWGKHFGGIATSEAPHGIGTDAQKNIYVTGYFGSTTTTGALNANFNPAGGGTISTQGNEDIFVAKYDKDGNYPWAFGLGNIGQETQERAWDISTDASGNSSVVGGFHGTMNFDPLGTALNLSLPDASAGLFIAKYNSSGICQWAEILDVKGTSVFNETYATCDLDNFGNLYVAGNFRGTGVNFNPLATTTTLSSAGQNDIFIARYNTVDGTLHWAKQIGGAAQDLVSPGALRCDSNGNPYFTDRLSGVGSVDFDPSAAIKSITNSALYITSYDSSGNLRYAVDMGSGAGDGGHRIEFDNNNNVYIAGWMNGTATFGTISRTAFSPTADCFLAKYSNDLSNCFWAFNFGGTGSSANNIVAGLSVDQENNPIITGQLYGTNADIDPSANTKNFTSIGNNDCFVIKYNSNGLLWTETTLPLRFLSFSGAIKDNNKNLIWQTQNEINTSYFAIEKSLDGLSFEKIGEVKSFSNSTIVNSYSFIDKGVTTKSLLYYRLKQIDIDGKFTYSKVLALKVANENNQIIHIYPNPSKNILRIDAGNSNIKTYRIANQLGVVIASSKINSQIDISHLPIGVYCINFYNEFNFLSETKMFVKE